MIKHYVIALVDNDFGTNPVFFAEFGNDIGIVPNREKALVVDGAVVDWYVEKAQRMANKMMADAFLPVEKARKAVAWEVNQ